MYSHAETSGQGGALLAFHAPHCADFLRFLSVIDVCTIFFKLQADVSLVSSAPPLRLPRPVPRLRPTQNGPFKITLLCKYDDKESGHLCWQKILSTQIELHTYSNILSIVRLFFISAGREQVQSCALAYPPSRHIQIHTVEILGLVVAHLN
jgi:hypothetical protein